MIVHRRAPALWVFAVEDTRAQVVWRNLRPGSLRLEVRGTEASATATSDGGPGSVLLEHLPPGRLLDIDVSGDALDDPRALQARTLRPLPGEELFRLATVSDLHLGTEVFGHRGTLAEPIAHPDPHPIRCSRAAFAELTAWGAQRVVAKGDLTNLGAPAQWRQYASLVAAAGVPVDAVPGNHDHARPGARGALLPREAAAAFGLSIADPIQVHDVAGLRLILADTTRAGRHGGTVAPVLADVLDAASGADRDGGVLLVLHHHLLPIPVTEGWPPGVGYREGLDLLDRLGRAHPHVFVTSGHTHRHRRWARSGVVVTQVGSTKDYPGVWAGYVVAEGGIRQTVRRVAAPDCLAWTDHSRLAAFGLWEHAAPGRLDARCFNVEWTRPA